MNGKVVKKIKREINSKEKEMCEQIFDYFNSLRFFERVKIAMRIIRKKL